MAPRRIALQEQPNEWHILSGIYYTEHRALHPAPCPTSSTVPYTFRTLPYTQHRAQHPVSYRLHANPGTLYMMPPGATFLNSLLLSVPPSSLSYFRRNFAAFFFARVASVACRNTASKSQHYFRANPTQAPTLPSGQHCLSADTTQLESQQHF